MSDTRFSVVAGAGLADWQRQLAHFERQFDYPLGERRFRIDHGEDYGAFFRRLGEPTAVLAHDEDGSLLGVLIAVRRRLGARELDYVCDLKIAPSARATRVAVQLLRTWARSRPDDSAPAFGVSMNAPGGRNRLWRTAQRCREAGPVRADGLVLFSLDYGDWQRVGARVEAELGPVAWYDPHGVKDIVLLEPPRRMPLLHAQYGPWAEANQRTPRPDHTHMFCLPAGDPLTAALAELGVAPDASATILHRGADGVDWRALLTSDI